MGKPRNTTNKEVMNISNRRYTLLSEFNKRDENGDLLCRNFNECNNPIKKPYHYYCSKDCQQKIIREAYSFLYFRSDVLKRDNYTCQDCGAKYHYENPIEAHHIVPVKDGGSCDLSNGIALCKRCHVKVGRKLNNARRIQILKRKHLSEGQKTLKEVISC